MLCRKQQLKRSNGKSMQTSVSTIVTVMTSYSNCELPCRRQQLKKSNGRSVQTSVSMNAASGKPASTANRHRSNHFIFWLGHSCVMLT